MAEISPCEHIISFLDELYMYAVYVHIMFQLLYEDLLTDHKSLWLFYLMYLLLTCVHNVPGTCLYEGLMFQALVYTRSSLQR